MTTRWNSVDGDNYDRKWTEMAAAGIDPHGEVAFVQRFEPTSVLDAGCGTGRVAIELDRRGVAVTGTDVDAEMIATAQRKAPHLEWVQADLADVSLLEPAGDGTAALRQFDVAVLAGNVMIFVAPGTEHRVLDRMAAHVRPGGRVICGFQLNQGWSAKDHRAAGGASGLELEEQWSTWDGQPFTETGDYGVFVHVVPGPPLSDAGR